MVVKTRKGQVFSQEYTDIVKNNGSAHKSCKNIKVYKAEVLGNSYNVSANCDYYRTEYDHRTSYSHTYL